MPGLLPHIADGTADLAWFDVSASHEGDFAIFSMLTDAPRVDGVRLTVTAEEALECAWHLGACLPTPRLLDLRWAACRCKVDPQPKHYRGGVGMDTPEAVRAHSQRIDAAASGTGVRISNVGKHWVTSRRTTVERAVLYGWHTPELGNRSWRGIKLHPSSTPDLLSVIQPESAAHDWHHHDYSMTLMVVRSDVRVLKRGEPWQALTLRDVLTDERLCGLACHDGPYTDGEILRRPGDAIT